MSPRTSEPSDGEAQGARRDTGRGSRRTSVADAVERFSPTRVPPAVWARIEDIAKDWVLRANPGHRTQAVSTMGIVTQLLWWADGEGQPLDPQVLLRPEAIDRFLDRGCRHLKPGTRSSYRTALRRVGRVVLDPALFPPPSIEIPARDPEGPYTAEEVNAQRSWVRGLPTEQMRRNALVLLALGLGAGLRAEEMARMRGSEVFRAEHGVVVRVVRKREREIPVLASWEDVIFDLADEVGECLVFRPDRTQVLKNQTSNFISRCAKSVGGPPAFSLLRLRSTWIVNHFVAGIPPNVLADAAGIQRTQLAKFFNLMPDYALEEASHWLREGGRP
ncbi:MAG: hypothetical protein WB565_06515 [Acidimicrobiales bacterium]